MWVVNLWMGLGWDEMLKSKYHGIVPAMAMDGHADDG